MGLTALGHRGRHLVADFFRCPGGNDPMAGALPEAELKVIETMEVVHEKQA